jgi:excinuclease ABC subunit A
MGGSGEWIKIRGARTHNLQSLSVDLPRDALCVITGPSGSGKSSLAFDTLFAEGRRRYLETLRGDKRALFQQLQRPDVDAIEGLPPVVCVSQHAASARPRSTLATVTEIHDHLRLLYARFGTPYCPNCRLPIHKHTLTEIIRAIMNQEGRKIFVLAPLVQDRPGDHKDQFLHIRQTGFVRARVDGVLMEIRDNPKIDPNKNHTIELIVDRLVVKPAIEERLRESLATATQHGHGRVVITDLSTGDWLDDVYSTRYACVRCQASVPDLEPRNFSFNNPHGACPRCTGFGQVWEFDPKLIVSDRSWTLGRVLERLEELAPEGMSIDRRVVKSFQEAFSLEAQTRLVEWPDEAYRALLEGADRGDPAFPGLLGILRAWTELLSGEDGDEQHFLALTGFVPCPECGGARLNREARAVRFADKGLHEVTALSVEAAAAFFAQLVDADSQAPAHKACAMLLTEIAQRLQFLQQVGLGYLTLDRPAPTLSGGEAQRARLAMHLGGGLLGVCYILDEPTMGLHPRDTQRLLDALRGLQTRGNTVLVVEHDETVIRQADYLVDIGPGAGRQGGQLLACGIVAEVLANSNSVTGKCLNRISDPEALAKGLQESFANASGSVKQRWITIRGACHHNLKNIDAGFPVGRWTCLSGVSGSGKSSLARDILCHAARRHFGLLAPTPGAHDRIEGLEQLDKVLEVDQKPLGKTPRSSPATYVGLFDEIRKVFAATRLAKIRGYQANRFSFNVKGGRCEECQGQGVVRVELAFMPDLRVTCSACQGKRFNAATLEVRYRGLSIADVLDLPIEAAGDFFANIPMLQGGLQALNEVGLGYLALGQPANTLSGGEAQRVKLAAELAKTSSGKTLYLFDEPTTGLHFVDVARLICVFRRLVDAGNTIVVVEHHLDMIAASDWVIDLGPEGGANGGEVVCAGTPRDIAACPRSITGRYLQAQESKHLSTQKLSAK